MINTPNKARRALKYLFISHLENLDDVPQKNGYLDTFWDKENFQVHSPYCLGNLAFYRLFINDSNQFGHFFLGKDGLNVHILVRFQGSAGQK